MGGTTQADATVSSRDELVRHPVWFHQEAGSTAGTEPFYFCECGPVGHFLDGVGGIAALERLESMFGPEYEALVSPGERVYVGWVEIDTTPEPPVMRVRRKLENLEAERDPRL